MALNLRSKEEAENQHLISFMPWLLSARKSRLPAGLFYWHVSLWTRI